MKTSSVCTMKSGQALRTRHRLLRLKSNGSQHPSTSLNRELCREDLQGALRMQCHNHPTINNRVRTTYIALKYTNPSEIQVTTISQGRQRSPHQQRKPQHPRNHPTVASCHQHQEDLRPLSVHSRCQNHSLTMIQHPLHDPRHTVTIAMGTAPTAAVPTISLNKP